MRSLNHQLEQFEIKKKVMGSFLSDCREAWILHSLLTAGSINYKFFKKMQD